MKNNKTCGWFLFCKIFFSVMGHVCYFLGYLFTFLASICSTLYDNSNGDNDNNNNNNSNNDDDDCHYMRSMVIADLRFRQDNFHSMKPALKKKTETKLEF